MDPLQRTLVLHAPLHTLGVLVTALDAPVRGLSVALSGTALSSQLIACTAVRARPWSGRLAPWETPAWSAPLSVSPLHATLHAVLVPPRTPSRTLHDKLGCAVWVALEGRALRTGTGSLLFEVTSAHAPPVAHALTLTVAPAIPRPVHATGTVRNTPHRVWRAVREALQWGREALPACPVVVQVASAHAHPTRVTLAQASQSLTVSQRHALREALAQPRARVWIEWTHAPTPVWFALEALAIGRARWWHQRIESRSQLDAVIDTFRRSDYTPAAEQTECTLR